jgi:Flp pilus assembly protein TadD
MKPARYARSEMPDGPPALPTASPELASAIAAARVDFDAGHDMEAQAQLEAALALDPASAAALNLLGVTQRRLGRFADARATYERAINVDPTYAAPQRNLAILLDLYLNDPSAALGHYEQYQGLTADADKEVGTWLVELRTRLGQVSRTAEAKP